jgi:uncharacterized membrane protein SpoIIM required for sporulation/uncharacterized RDD family membrane protein YckC
VSASPAGTLAAAPAITVPSSTGIEARVVLAGPGARSIAFVLDWLIRGALAMAYLLLAAWAILGNLDFEVPPDSEMLWYLAGVVPATAIYILYHLVLETLMAGRTPGKRLIGLRILTPEGVVPSAGALLTRNVFRVIDQLPMFYMVGLMFVIFGRRHLRIGDLAAGTVLAVERAPFLERLGLERLAAGRGTSSVAAWQEARRRAVVLGRRHGSEVADALATVDDYRRAANALGDAAAANDTAGLRRAEYLEAAYADLHDTIHRPARRAGLEVWSLLRDRVPAAMHTMRAHLLAVTLLFVISAVTGWWLVYTYPDLIAMFADPGLIATVERGELWTEGMLNVAPSAVYSVSILTNNIAVSLFAFGSGFIFGLGTFYLIGLNGIQLGAIYAFTQQHGLGGKLFDFIVAHGCVELSCICLAGAAGAYIGEALIRPGELTRTESFRRATSQAMLLMVVVTLLLLFCGFIEGYVSPDPEIPRWARVTIGVGYWFFMVSLLRGYVFGRSRGGEPIAR